MHRRFIRRLVCALVAAQVLLSAPVASALADLAASAGEMPCAGTMPMPMPADADSCPCCPEGERGAAACLSACAASAGAAPSLGLAPRRAATDWPAARPQAREADLTDPPLKPPPIV